MYNGYEHHESHSTSTQQISVTIDVDECCCVVDCCGVCWCVDVCVVCIVCVGVWCGDDGDCVCGCFVVCGVLGGVLLLLLPILLCNDSVMLLVFVCCCVVID